MLLLAGNIIPLNRIDMAKDFFDFVSDNYEQVFWIAGNHEYYGFDIAEKGGSFMEKIRKNVTLLNNDTIECGGVKLIFTTLWSKISSANRWYIQNRLNDFRRIKNDGMAFTPDHYNELHKECLAFLKEEFYKNKYDKTIVITHHVPTLLNYPDEYKGDVLNNAFAVELFDLIEKSGIDYWIYGHHHSNIPAFKIGKTTMLTNQIGYAHANEHLAFNPKAVIEL